MKTFTQVFHYEILQEKPLEELLAFKEHRRLRVFYNKGTVCVTCGKVGTRLIQGKGRGNKHWDIYTENLYPLTVDHIIPKSLGGSDELDNLQPMCAGCNFKKGNGMPYNLGTIPWVPKGFQRCSNLDDFNILIGKDVWKRKTGSEKAIKKIYHLGIVDSIFLDENNFRHYVTIVGKADRKNTYSMKYLFIPKNHESHQKV